MRNGFSDGVSYAELADRLMSQDEYLLLADFNSYCEAHKRSIETYADREQWNRMSLINVARSGIFAADRSISDYAHNIWNVPTRN